MSDEKKNPNKTLVFSKENTIRHFWIYITVSFRVYILKNT